MNKKKTSSVSKKPTSSSRALAIPLERVERRIYQVRGQKVMLDCDLAELYKVATKRLNEAVKRNAKRFPEDFMFQLNLNEFENWRSQIATSNSAVRMGVRRPPYAFTELGVAMLSSVLNSGYAIEMNILIMRTFVKLREVLGSHKELARRVDRIDAELRQHNNAITLLAGEIRELRAPQAKPSRRIGFLSAVSPRTT